MKRFVRLPRQIIALFVNIGKWQKRRSLHQSHYNEANATKSLHLISIFVSLEHSNRRWLRKLCFFLKIFKNKSLGYLYSIYPQRISPYITRNIDSFSF